MKNTQPYLLCFNNEFTLDIGNTLTKIAVSDGKSILTEFKLRSIDLTLSKIL